ncbi:MAG: pyridoxal-phosphate dependent enzyme [Bacteroidia bacterium]|nr:pyridoxal-phosphate dependent enzyme [Bacteroidia bacterium]
MSHAKEVFSSAIFAPVQKLLLPLAQKNGIDIFVKREDMIHPFVSGNKWRKLKYNLLEAETAGYTTLLTFGGAYSNHLLATACAAALCGFKSKGLVRGDEKSHNPVLGLCRTFGMELVFVSREDYRNKEHLAATHADNSTYVLNEGGTNYLAVRGCAEIVNEVNDFFDHVLVACGTGGTLSGLAKGFAQKHPETKVHGVAVLKQGEFLAEVVNELAPGLSNWHLHVDDHLGGYAKTTPMLLDLIRTTATGTGILFDQVYTGKMLHACLRMIREKQVKSGERVLLIHTGGLTGYLSQV